jgi:hypothetical protein
MKELMNPSFLLLSSLYGMISGYLAYKRNKNPYLWFFIGFCFGLIGIAFFFLPKKKAIVKRKPALILKGPSDKLWFYLDSSHKQIGPISYSAIAKAFSQQLISLDTFVWHETLTDWKKLGDFIVSEQTALETSL